MRRQRGRSLEGADNGDGQLEAGEKTRLRQHRWRSEQQQFQRPADDGDDIGELRDGGDWRRRIQQQLQPPTQQHHRHHHQQRRRPEEHRSRRKCKFRILTTACGEPVRAAAGAPEAGDEVGATGVAGMAGGPQPTTAAADVDHRRRSYYSEECSCGAPDLDIMTEFVSMAAATAWRVPPPPAAPNASYFPRWCERDREREREHRRRQTSKIVTVLYVHLLHLRLGRVWVYETAETRDVIWRRRHSIHLKSSKFDDSSFPWCQVSTCYNFDFQLAYIWISRNT